MDRGDGGTGTRGGVGSGCRGGVEMGQRGRGAGEEGAGSRGGGKGTGSGKREGAGSFYKSLKGVRHVLNPNAKLAYKRLFRLLCDTLES